MNRYRITLKHDAGRVRLILPAESESSARKRICDIEGCPPGAIVRVENLGPIGKGVR